MAKGKKFEDISTEKLKKLLLTYTVFAILGAIASITAVVFLFIDGDVSHNSLIVAAMIGVGIATVLISSYASKIKQEIKNRADK